MSVVGWPWKNLDPDRDQDPNHKVTASTSLQLHRDDPVLTLAYSTAQQLQSLQRLMRKGSRPAALLNHSFFAPLKEMPEAFSAERCVAVSSDGLQGIPAELHARALVTCAPPTPSAGRSSSGPSGNSPNTPTSRSPGGFAVPASPFHNVGPSGLRRSFAKPRQPFTPSSTVKLADEEDSVADLIKDDEPTPKKARRMSEPTTPSSSAMSVVKSESPSPTQQPAGGKEEPKKRRRFAKRTRPPKPSFLATADGPNKENTPNQSENLDADIPVAKKAKREEEAAEEETEPGSAADRESDDDDDETNSTPPARMSTRAKKAFKAYSPRERRKALSSRRLGTTR
jgi:hypothetical protein